MSFPDAYQSPQPVAHARKPGPRQLDYMRMYMFVFDNPNWIMNLIWGGLCVLIAGAIPIVPYMVIIGYMIFQIELWHRTGNDRYEDMDMNRLGDYIGRGVWPVLVGVVVSLVMCAILVPLFLISFFGVTAIAAAADTPALLILLIPAFLLVNAVALAFNVFLIPMLLRSSLRQDFGEAFNYNWVMSFAKLMWREILLGGLFLMLGNIIVTMIGVALFCIGVYPAAALTMYAWAHFAWQLYEIFLQRGGEPVPPKMQYLPPQQA